jgi:hypothetical protein
MADLSLFWSYAHLDDANDRGRVTMLAKHLSQEVAVISGLEVDLFLDRTSLAWGDEWEAKIDAALNSSTFLTCVVSPTYFRRPECRRELVSFYSQAESRKLEKLLLPLAYIEVPDFGRSNPDEVVAIASRYQYADWTSLRFKEPDSEEYRRGVNDLAVRLLAIHRSMSNQERQNIELAVASSDVREDSFLDVLGEIESRLPAWVDAVEASEVSRAQGVAIDRTYGPRLQSAPEAKKLAIRHKWASDELRLIAPMVEIARGYSALSIDMAPYVAAALRLAAENPGISASLRSFADAVEAARRNIAMYEREDWTSPIDYWNEWAAIGGVFKTLVNAHREYEAYVDEANDLVKQWHTQLTGLFGEAMAE